MGRVDEAMRRAASDPTPQAPPAGTPIEELVAEPYAAESDAAEPVDEPAAAPVPRAERPRSSDAPRNGVVFEHLSPLVSEKVVVDALINPSSREQYRRLAANLHHGQATAGLKVILIASALPGEGKSLTATNLALTFSESYQRRVLIIDGDLRRPSQHVIFGIDGSTGLSEGLTSPEETRLMLHQVTERLAILPAGRPTVDPMAGLISTRVQRILEEGRAAFDWVIVDTPPVALLSDANLLASMVDGVVLVIKADTTPYTLAQRAVAALGPDKILGVVLNQATQAAHHARYDYHYYYGSSRTSAWPAKS